MGWRKNCLRSEISAEQHIYIQLPIQETATYRAWRTLQLFCDDLGLVVAMERNCRLPWCPRVRLRHKEMLQLNAILPTLFFLATQISWHSLMKMRTHSQILPEQSGRYGDFTTLRATASFNIAKWPTSQGGNLLGGGWGWSHGHQHQDQSGCHRSSQVN